MATKSRDERPPDVAAVGAVVVERWVFPGDVAHDGVEDDGIRPCCPC